MKLSGLLPFVEDVPAYRQLLDAAKEAVQAANPDTDSTQGLGVVLPARPYLVAALYQQLNIPLILLTTRSERVTQWAEQMRIWTGSEQVYAFPEPDALPYERVPWSRETISDRITALAALVHPSSERAPVVVGSARALLQKTLPVREFRLGLRQYQVGQEIDLQRTLELWVHHGYRPDTVVEEPGTFSRRGGLVDVYPPNLLQPVRIELFGDEISSLRVFDPTTQRTLHQVDSFALAPATEALPRLAPAASERAAELDLTPCHPPARIEYREDLAHLEQGAHFRGINFYMPFFYSHPATLLDYLPGEGLCFVDDWEAVMATTMDLDFQARTLQADLVKAGELPEGFPRPYFQWDEVREALASRGCTVLGGQRQAGQRGLFAGVFAHGERYGGQLKRVLDGFQEMRATGQRAIVVSRQARRISELLEEREMIAVPVEDLLEPPPAGSLTLVQGTLAEGWILRTPEGSTPTLHLLTDAEVFGWARPAPRRTHRRRPVAPEAFFADVEPGTYVVHVEHGIGLFKGLVKMGFNGSEREYLLVEYAAGDKLYVPVYQADRLSRYVGVSEHEPHINRLGTAEWEQVKAKTQKAVEEIADDLLTLYAAREVVEGHAFSSDTLWQAELEASFPYIETEAQARALDEIKTDMEQPRPMDRLICGDVGYGKTEVALRAAFKAVMDGKQVAVLVPTTVLAQQHYQTFTERLGSFPVSVEMLSRFLTRKKQEEVVENISQGGVDIVIGTHRLLSNDVDFRDLGLLIIDEEQRFGVAHKERLKQMRQEVDVLTLTATPIPRTLHMSLTGVRDMSTIDTPPEERLPVRTHVGEYDETLIRQAILRELDRGGQVYFVHNRVMGIYQMAQRLRKLVPEVKMAVAHGQMAERELEQVMLEFAAGKVDVLVCTSIIESGLDIPNANTLIINRADRFGLAQLYQLRGRVGRGARRAYAYLLHPATHTLTETARQRLETLSEATELGAGFRIAMRDLEIRGAGELLGSRQHGHIAAVGFDLYTRLLAKAVQDARAQHANGGDGHAESRLLEEAIAYVQPLDQAVQINLPLAAYLPEDYIRDATLRLQMYRRLAGLTSQAEIDDMESEIEDRFGTPPPEAKNLFYQLQLKLLALAAGAKAIVTEEGQAVIRADSLEDLDREWLQRRLGDRGRVARRAVWLPLDKDRWRTALVAALQAIVDGLGRTTY
ncbi:MAG: transcription-repair coupling factor [Anaerolineae bacterium]|nr:transcription-repair coupling factor [Anaerolineae bacterium]